MTTLLQATPSSSGGVGDLVGELGIGIAIVLLVVVALIYIARKGYLEPESTNEDDLEEREHLTETGREDFRIPYRRRVSSWSAPMKVFVGSLVLVGLVAGFATYQIMRTGSPAHQYITREVRVGLIAIVGVAGGVKLRAWFDDQIAYLDVEYERPGQEPVVERIPYAKTGEHVTDGDLTVPQVASNRLLGLFWRYRQIREDRQLRGEDKPLDDVVRLLVPGHAVERPDGSGYHLTTKEEGDVILSGATSIADRTFRSPNQLSTERAAQLREANKRKNAELEATRATNAELNQQIRRMRKKIENREYRDREELMKDFKEFTDYLGAVGFDLTESSPDHNGSSGVEQDAEAEA